MFLKVMQNYYLPDSLAASNLIYFISQDNN